jgi:glutamyl-tRNA reductase
VSIAGEGARLYMVGINHATAQVELREQLAVADAGVASLAAVLSARGLADELLVLSTCNRTELYIAPGPRFEAEALIDVWAGATGARLGEVEPNLIQHRDADALQHLFRVASSLDSMVLGEPQIAGQLRRAYQVAVEGGSVGTTLRRSLDNALRVARRVRTETDISREAVSVGRAGVELARQVLGDLSGRSALLVGAGEHGKLVARALLDYGLSELVVANRTFQRASNLAERFGASAVPLADAWRVLERVDICMVSTGAGRILLDRGQLAPVMRHRRYRSLVLIDLSVPRNVSADVDALGGVYRFDVDDLNKVAQQGRASRQAEAQRGEAIVATEAVTCWGALRSAAAAERLGHLTRRAEEVRQAELTRGLAALGPLPAAQRDVIDAMTRALVKKILHPPLSTARRLAAEGREDELEQLLDGWGDRAKPTEGAELPPDTAADAAPTKLVPGSRNVG